MSSFIILIHKMGKPFDQLASFQCMYLTFTSKLFERINLFSLIFILEFYYHISSIDFFKAFNSVWHLALFHKLILAGLVALLDGLNIFFSDRRICVVHQNQAGRFFRVHQGVPQRSILGRLLISSSTISASPYSVSCFLYADDLAIWFPYLGACCCGNHTRNSDSPRALL